MINPSRKNALRVLLSVVVSFLILCQLHVATELTMNGYYRELDVHFVIPSTSTLPSLLPITQAANKTSNTTTGASILATASINNLHLGTNQSGFRTDMNNRTLSSSDAHDGIAVCLAFSDDNLILSEWLAYHYTTLPLRHLVLLVDPQSRTSPQDILNRWNQSHLVTSWIWTDADILSPYNQHKMNRMVRVNTPESLHKRLKFRQRDFVTACNRFFQQLSTNNKKITWVGHFDVDEFVVPNRVAPFEQSARKKQKLAKARHLKGDRIYRDAIKLREKLLDPKGVVAATPTTALEVLNRARKYYKFPDCIPMSRWNHGSKALKKDPLATKKQYHGMMINTSRLETLTYFRGDHPVRPATKLMGKMMVDIGQIPLANITRAISPHKPLPEPFCGGSDISHLESILALNHYKGSWERYSFRNDKRRQTTQEQWQLEDSKYWKTDSTHYQILKWLPRFIDLVGSEQQAAYLLGQH